MTAEEFLTFLREQVRKIMDGAISQAFDELVDKIMVEEDEMMLDKENWLVQDNEKSVGEEEGKISETRGQDTSEKQAWS